MDLSSDQRQAFDAIRTWFASYDEFISLGGLGGTGKTTLLGYLAKSFAAEDRLVAYVSYTGRAASILQRKLAAQGVQTTRKPIRSQGDAEAGERYFASDDAAELPLCTTIHGLLYRPVVDPQTSELRGWAKRASLDRAYDLIVVDEASMVSDEILRDIQAHGVPLLAVGDHGQLPPVRAHGSLMQNPHLRLEQIHRQAEKSPIIRLAHHVRNGGRLSEFNGYDAAVKILPRAKAAAEIAAALTGAGSRLDVATLCWTNKNRVQLNAMTRKALGYSGTPRKGELFICLKNTPPVYNGMRGILSDDSRLDRWILNGHLKFPDEDVEGDFIMCASQFNREKTFASLDEIRAAGIDVWSLPAAGDLFDFGYALTAHKAQGSTLQHALVYFDRPEKPSDDDYRRWAYTAISRAASRLTILR